MLRKLFKGYVILDTILDILFMVFLLFVLCGLVYYRELYQNPLYLLIAAVIFVALLIGIYSTIRKVVNIE